MQIAASSSVYFCFCYFIFISMVHLFTSYFVWKFQSYALLTSTMMRSHQIHFVYHVNGPGLQYKWMMLTEMWHSDKIAIAKYLFFFVVWQAAKITYERYQCISILVKTGKSIPFNTMTHNACSFSFFFLSCSLRIDFRFCKIVDHFSSNQKCTIKLLGRFFHFFSTSSRQIENHCVDICRRIINVMA